jgi:hypothetical protein
MSAVVPENSIRLDPESYADTRSSLTRMRRSVSRLPERCPRPVPIVNIIRLAEMPNRVILSPNMRRGHLDKGCRGNNTENPRRFFIS